MACFNEGMRRVIIVLALPVLVVLGGAACTSRRDSPPPSPSPTVTASALDPVTTSGRAGRSASPHAGPSARGARPSPGWTVTVYYTAVERFHRGATARVRGCPGLQCANGDADLGSYPESFVDAVAEEGTGRTSAGRYLNWSDDVGYWLDVAPRDSAGRALRPFESAAADADVMPAGTRFTIADCGRDDDDGPIPAAVCTRLRAARWVITDEFTPGLGGGHHVDVYIGEESGPDFTDSDWYTTLNSAWLLIA